MVRLAKGGWVLLIGLGEYMDCCRSDRVGRIRYPWGKNKEIGNVLVERCSSG